MVLKCRYTRSPSVAGVEAAWLFGGVMRGSVPVSNSDFHFGAPVAASKACTATLASPAMPVA